MMDVKSAGPWWGAPPAAVPELTCGACGWQGARDRLSIASLKDGGDMTCPNCGCDAGPDGSVYPTEPADMMCRGTVTTMSDASPSFDAQLSDAMAKHRGIDPGAARDDLRVRTFEEKEAERLRMAEHFKKVGLL